MGFVWFFYVLLWFSFWFRHISEPLPLRTTAQGAQVSRSRPLGCSGRSFRDWRITRLLNLRSFVRRVWLWHGEFMRVYPSTIWVSSWLYVNPQFWWIFSRVLQFRKVIYTKTYTNGFDHFNKWHLTNKTGDYLGSKNTQHLYQVVFLNDDFTKNVSEPTQHIEVTSNLKGFFCHKTWSFTMFYPPRLRFKDHKNRFFHNLKTSWWLRHGNHKRHQRLDGWKFTEEKVAPGGRQCMYIPSGKQYIMHDGLIVIPSGKLT